MTPATRSTLHYALRALSWILFAFAAVTFWAGGVVISALTGTSRFLGEVEGVGAAAAIGVLAYVFKMSADDFGQYHQTSGR